MTPLGFIIVFVCAALVMTGSRRKAVAALLIGMVYTPFAQSLDFIISLPAIRILTLAGLARVVSRGERMNGPINIVDKMMFVWALCTMASFPFHKGNSFVFRAGLVVDCLGVYYVFRALIRDMEDVRHTFKVVCIPFVLVGLGLLVEKVTGKNVFSIIGGCPETAGVRKGSFRGQGPFGHAILGGTIGALVFPMAMYFWKWDRKRAIIGMGVGLAIVYGSGSSGPIMTLAAILAAAAFWPFRWYLKMLCWAGVAMTIALDIVMKDPVYFLLARIDLTGGSTAWHRSALIQASIQYFNEWWLAGTDRTRHWMPTGVYWSNEHTDITNYFIQMGVYGGILLMSAFIGVIVAAFITLGRLMKKYPKAAFKDRYLLWIMGSILFGHVSTFFSVSYFDQTVVFYYMLLASIGSLAAVKLKPATAPAMAPAPVTEKTPAGLSAAT